MPECSPSNETPLDTDAAFDLLSNARRRGVLYAVERDGAVSVEELASRVAAWQVEGGRSGDGQSDDGQCADGEHSVEQVLTSLVHAHLPRLDDADVVDYDPETGRVEPGDVDGLDPLLRAADESKPSTVGVDRRPSFAD